MTQHVSTRRPDPLQERARELCIAAGGAAAWIGRSSREEFIELAKNYPSRDAFLRALGTEASRKSKIYHTQKRMAAERMSLDDLWPVRRAHASRFHVDHHALDMNIDAHAYLYGLALSDGSLNGRKSNPRASGLLSIEIRSSDNDVLKQLANQLPWPCRIVERSRQSPFDGTEYRSTALHCRSADLRCQMIDAGFPVGTKSRTCQPPDGANAAFWRGMLDGDGSLGLTAAGLPFVSLITKSPAVADGYLDFVAKVAGYRPRAQPNRRDDVWNIMVTRQRAVDVVQAVYKNESLCIGRKAQSALAVLRWVKPPDGRSRVNRTKIVDTIEPVGCIMAGQSYGSAMWRKKKGKGLLSDSPNTQSPPTAKSRGAGAG